MCQEPRIAVAAPARVRDRLAGPERVAAVVHRGELAIYLDLGGWCLGVLSRHAAGVPCALRTAYDELAWAQAADQATVLDGRVHLAGHTLVVGRVLDVAVPDLGCEDLLFARDHLRAPASVTDELPVGALAALTADQPGSVAALVGLGSGLTPLGDDVLAGWLAVHAAAGRTSAVAGAVAASAHRTTLLSATLLDCAVHGEVVPEFRALLLAVRSRSADAVGRRAAALTRIGHTSGTGLLYGAVLAARHLSGVRLPEPRLPSRTVPLEGARCA